MVDMSGRSTADIVADLSSGNIRRIADAARETADRLAELDGECDGLFAQLQRIDALLPTCLTCAGYPLTEYGKSEGHDPCPDCVDGKVSIEQLAATWRAVWLSFWDDDQAAVRLPDNELTATAKHLLAYLRAVRP